MSDHPEQIPDQYFRNFGMHPEDYELVLAPLGGGSWLKRAPFFGLGPSLKRDSFRCTFTMRHKASGLALTVPLHQWPTEADVERFMPQLWDRFCNAHNVRELNAKWLAKRGCVIQDLTEGELSGLPLELQGGRPPRLPRQPEGQGDLSGAPPQPDAEQGSG